MRFQTTGRVPCEDAEMVLAVLEDRLHTLAHTVVREGRRITLFGLGPSPRAVNPRDKTMIDVSAADGVTKIDADVTFQASAFVGDVPQDEIVLEKLERVFEEIKAELGLRARRETQAPVPLLQKVIPIESAAVERDVAVASAPEVAEILEEMVGTVAEDVSSAVVEEAPVAEIEEPPAAAPIARVDEQRPVEVVPIVVADPMPSAAVEPEPIAGAEPSIFLAAETTERAAKRWPATAALGVGEEERVERRRTWWLAAAACAAVAAVLGAPYLLEAHKPSESADRPVPVATQPAPTVATVAAPAKGAKPPLPGEAEDPAEVVKQWGVAMQSRDAAGQAAFYADPVDRYFLQHNVGKDTVLADKQAAIDTRKGSWTVKMERVKVDRSGDLATVSLVKHFQMQQEGEPASEWFIPSQLKLKRVDGRWRIVSERDLGWASSLDDLDG